MTWCDRLQKFLASRDIDDAYDIGEVLGKGAYSVVKAAKAKKTKDEVRSQLMYRVTMVVISGRRWWYFLCGF